LNTIEQQQRHDMPSINRKQTPNPWSSHGDNNRPTKQDTRYWSRAWKKARAAYLKKHPVCVSCREFANVVDHVIPVRDGGPFWESNNWQSLCVPCHNRKSAHENVMKQKQNKQQR